MRLSSQRGTRFPMNNDKLSIYPKTYHRQHTHIDASTQLQILLGKGRENCTSVKKPCLAQIKLDADC